MSNVWILILVLAVVVCTAAIVSVIVPYLKRRGVDMKAILDKTKEAIITVNNTLEMIRPFLKESNGVDVFDKIITAASTGVGQAEQLYLMGELEPRQRKEAAREYILDACRLMGIEVTPDVLKLIDGAIEAEVLWLGHISEIADLTLSLPNGE